MNYFLFLDDSRLPREVTWANLPNVPWVGARSYEDFEMVIRKFGIPAFVAYDCDLCQEHYDAFFELQHRYVLHYNEFKTPCGIHCAQLLMRLCKRQGVPHPPFIAHTQNHYVRGFIENMIAKFNREERFITYPDKLKPDFMKVHNAWEEQVIIPPYAIHDDQRISGFFGPYRFLSNFWPAEVSYKNLKFASVEVAYQAAKCQKTMDMLRFASLDASGAKRLGKNMQTYGIEFRPDWDTVRASIMGYLVMQKFDHHEDLRKQLIDTGKRKLIEANAWKDSYWGEYWQFDFETRQYVNRGGMNKLGTILGKVREVLN